MTDSILVSNIEETNIVISNIDSIIVSNVESVSIISTSEPINQITSIEEVTDVIISITPDVSTIISSGQQGPPGAIGLTGPTGPQGIPGSAGNGSATALTFSWGDATPALIATIQANKTVYKVEVILLTPFDQVSTLTVGDSSNHSQLFESTNIDLQEIGVYQSNPGYKYSSQTEINLYITLGSGNSTGSGILLLYIQE